MDNVLAGRLYEHEEFLIDFDGDPVLDASWSEESFDTPTGNPISWDVRSDGNGFYVFSFRPVDRGYYDLVVTTELQGQTITYHIECYAESVVYYENADTTTLAELRSMVARQFKDYRRVTAMSGSTTTITDVFNLVDNTDHFRGAEVICRSGHPDNVGLKRKVVSSSYEQYTLTFIPPLPQPVQEGDVFELYNFSRFRNTIQDYDSAINDAIKMAFPQNREELYMELGPGSYRADYGGIVIPDIFVAIYAVSFNVDGEWYTISASRYKDEAGWFVDKARRVLTLGYGYRQEVQDRPTRIYGYGQPRNLVYDTDVTGTDPEWILDSVVGQLATSAMDQATFPIGQSRANRADQLRGKMWGTSKPNTVSLL